MAVRILIILSTFYVMGFGDVRGSFVGISKEVFGVTAAQASLIPFCGAVAFGLFAVPAGLLATRRGKKFLMLTGLLIAAAGHAAAVLPAPALQPPGGGHLRHRRGHDLPPGLGQSAAAGSHRAGAVRPGPDLRPVHQEPWAPSPART